MNPVQPMGRGALILQTLRRLDENRAGVSTESSEEPPKPRGRAALLQKLRCLNVGSLGPVTSSTVSQEVVLEHETEPDNSLQTASIVEKFDAVTPVTSYKGSVGKSINISANYIRLTIDQDKGAYEYDCTFEPDVDSKHARIKIINANIEALGGVKMFDGSRILYLPIKMKNIKTVFTSPHPLSGEMITLSIIYKKTLRIGQCIQMFNVLFKRVMSALKLSRIGRNYYDTPSSKLIPQHRLEILPGYAIAVDEYEGGLMVCLDTQHRVLRTITVLEHMRDIQRENREGFREALKKSLLGSVVITKYNNRTYVIDDILWDLNPQGKFKNSQGNDISFVEYYAKQHGLHVTDLNQPLLLNVKKRKVNMKDELIDMNICLIPEFCNLTGLTDFMRSDFNVMKDVAAYTRITAHQRMAALRKYLNNIKSCPEAVKILGDWGLTLADGTIDLNARLLPAQMIMFGNNQPYQCDFKADWSGALSKNKVVGPIDLYDWVIIYTQRDAKVAQEFATNMCRLGSNIGCNITTPKLYSIPNDRTNNYIQAITKLYNDNVQCMVFICPTARDDLYSSIKKMTLCQKPVASQVILSKNLNNIKKVRTVTLKIALQINCKLGGSLWSVKIPVTSWMVCGIDTYHSAGSKVSVGALVSSTNSIFTSYYTTCIRQEKELSDALKVPFARSLLMYRQRTGIYPTQIIIYRDGVGDGQFDHVKRYELSQYLKALDDLKITETKLCLIVVQKRLNTRLISNDSVGNPPSGTIVDECIISKNNSDFYLVPQNVNQGTATPCHYTVLYDDAKLKPDHVQMLTYKLCHMYYNWSGTIKVPAPCQYAHKAAWLIGQYLGKDPNEVLNDKLYYL